MKRTLTFLFLLLNISLFAQETFTERSSNLLFNFGRNKHGTGDMPGYQYGVTYNHYFSKFFFYVLGFEGTLNDDEQTPFIYEEPDGNIVNATLNDVTAGFQILAGVGYAPIKVVHHDLGLNVNALGRYKATSINDIQEILYPPLTGFPVPIRFITNYEKQRTLALGAALKVFYNYKFNSGWLINLTGAFQLDTNGDTISSVMLGFGKSF